MGRRIMSAGRLTRRTLVVGAAMGSATIFVRPLKAAEYKFVQYHNQAATSSLHRRLVEMWNAIGTETGGRVDTQVFAENNKIPARGPCQAWACDQRRRSGAVPPASVRRLCGVEAQARQHVLALLEAATGPLG
jgi:hypothetical protein